MLSDQDVRPIITTTKDRTRYAGNINSIDRPHKSYEPIEKQRVVSSTAYNLENTQIKTISCQKRFI